MDYIYTVKGSRSEEDAMDFMVGILSTEYSAAMAKIAVDKGFKRVLAQTNEEITTRLEKMSNLSPGEFAYCGLDQEDGLSIYTFWGKTGSHIT